MKIDLSKLDDSAWVKYEGGVELKIRPLSASKQEALKNKASSNQIEFVNGRRVTVQKLNDREYEELLRDWIIEDWRGIVDQGDEPIPCTLEMKMPILDHLHKMRAFALDAALDLQSIKQKDQAENSKN